MGILDKILKIGGLQRAGDSDADTMKAANPSIKKFDKASDMDDDTISNSVLIDKMYEEVDGNGGSQRHQITGYKQAVYGNISSDKGNRLQFYRNMAAFPEVSDAIDEICESCINEDDEGNIVQINLNEGMGRKLDVDIIRELEIESEEFLAMYDFDSNGHDYFRSLVIDGEITWENIIDEDTVDEEGLIGVVKLRPETYEYLVDENLRHQGIVINGKLLNGQEATESYNTDTSKLYKNQYSGQGQGFQRAVNDMGNRYKPRNPDKDIIVFPMKQVTHVNSGIFSDDGMQIESYLERARRAYRQLTLLEDAVIIYRLVRSPERYVFNVNTGKLPPSRAEQYVTQMKDKFQNQRVYDPSSNDVVNGYDASSIMENFWFAKPSDGSGGTDVTTIGGQNSAFSQLDDLKYFQQKLFVSLKVPFNRFNADERSDIKNYGDSLSYQEYRFAKFISKIQDQMAKGLKAAFKTHLQLKGLWEDYELTDRHFKFKFTRPTIYELFYAQKILDVKVANYNKLAGNEDISREYAQETYLEWSPAMIQENRLRREKERMQEAYTNQKIKNIESSGTPEGAPEAGGSGGFGF